MLELAPQLRPEQRSALGYRHAQDALWDPRGWGLRTTPCRRTLVAELADLGRVFVKHRRGRQRDARREWHALASLHGLGVRVPAALFRASRGRDSVVGMAQVEGRAMDVLLAAGDAGARTAARAAMPELCQRLHRAGWVFRDLYWNHVFLGPGGLALIDVERAFRPRWRRRRWVVKDLAGLVASLPDAAAMGPADLLRGLRRYDPSLDRRGRLGLARDVLRKAARIRGHRTRYPG